MKGDTPMTPPPSCNERHTQRVKISVLDFVLLRSTHKDLRLHDQLLSGLLLKLSATFAETVRTSAEIIRTSAEIVRTFAEIVRTSAETPSAFLILRPNIFDSSAEFWHF